MIDKEVSVTVDISDIEMEPFNYPVSFICGKDAILRHFNTKEPESGIVIYVFHESEVGDGEWIPDMSDLDSHRIASYCTPESYFDFMKRIINILDTDNLPPHEWNFSKLEGIL